MKLCKILKSAPHLYLVLLAILVTAPSLFAQDHETQPGNSPPSFRLDTDELEPVLVYNQVHYLLAEADPEPLVRVYGNGRVLVHRPAYMIGAGDYELQLNPGQLNTLIRSLANDGIIDFDHPAVHNQRRQLIDRKRDEEGILFHISDTTETIIDIGLAEYQRSPQSEKIYNLKRRFSWKNLEFDAKNFPQLEKIKGAAAGAQRMHSILGHPGLTKIK